MTAPSIRLRRADAPALGPGVQLRVSHTLLPLYWLRGVPVLRDLSHELTVFERFILEMALELGTVSGEDVTEVLDLRPEFLIRGAWRLAVAGALRLDGDVYRVVPDAARKLRQTRVLPQRVQSTADFVLLPRTGDLLAVASGRGGGVRKGAGGLSSGVKRVFSCFLIKVKNPAQAWPIRLRSGQALDGALVPF